MAYCRPAGQFCCGCSMNFGIKFLLLMHLAINIAGILEAVNLTFFSAAGGLGGEPLGVEALLAGFALAGVPLIVAALWGVVAKCEAVIRLYLFYLFFTFAFDSYFIVKVFLLSGPCDGMPHALEAAGKAFACGVARIANGTAVGLAWAIQLYIIYIVWSYVEDMASGGGPDLSDLVVDEDAFMLKRRLEDPFSSIAGLGEHVPAEYGSVYDAAVDGGMGSSARIFNGHRHEMMYPPPKGLMKVC